MEPSSPSSHINNIPSSIQNTQELTLPGIEVSVFSRFGFAVFVFSICIWVLLWSRNQVQQTKVALGQKLRLSSIEQSSSNNLLQA